MRYPASEKLEIIRLVEQSHLPARRTLDKLGIAKTTFYRWYDRYHAFGMAVVQAKTSCPTLTSIIRSSSASRTSLSWIRRNAALWAG